MKSLVCGVAVLTLLVTTVATQHDAVLKPGAEAPSFSLPTLDGGREVLRNWCGEQLLRPHANSIHHTVIISFWATYCKPCEKEIPELMSFARKHADRPLKIFLISIDREGASIVAPFVEKHEVDLPVLLDPYARTAARYGVGSVPALFVIGPNGVIRYSAMGYDENTNLIPALDSVLSDIDAGRDVVAGEVTVIGASVEARRDTAAEGGTTTLSPKQRWELIVRVESGENSEDVAAQAGVSPDQLKEWYQDIRRCALELWSEPQSGGSADNRNR